MSRMSKRKIILFYPRTYHERNYRYYHIPYSVLAVAAPLHLGEFDVIIIDNNVNKKEDYKDFISGSNDEILCIGISCMIGAQIKDALRFAKQVKEINPQIPIIWGGALPTLLPEKTTSHGLIDITVRGQGEITFSELVYRSKQNIPWNSVLGISYSNNRKIIHNPDRPFEDLNKFPPYRKVYPLINVGNYIWPDEHIASRTVSYHSSQGCPYRCGFCCEVPLWKRWWSGLTAKRMLDDIQYLVKKFNINGVKFYDSEFFIRLNRALEFAKYLPQMGIKIKWAASVHPRNLYRMKSEQLKLFAKSGLRRLLIGVESGVHEELTLIEKKINKQIISEIADRCASNNIIACFTFVTGYPGMPDKYIDQNLEFAEHLMKTYPMHEVKLHLYGPYPGTPLYPLALKHGFVPPKSLEEWADFDYYEVTTPWTNPRWVQKIREINERYYPYIRYPALINDQEVTL